MGVKYALPTNLKKGRARKRKTNYLDRVKDASTVEKIYKYMAPDEP